jgi:hypothetical protein
MDVGTPRRMRSRSDRPINPVVDTALTASAGQAGDDDVIDEDLRGAAGGRPTGNDGPEEQLAGQQVPQFVADHGAVDLTTVEGLRQDVVDQGFALVDELEPHDVVERAVTRYLDKHRAQGAGVLAALLADQPAHSQQIAPKRAGIGRTAASPLTPGPILIR